MIVCLLLARLRIEVVVELQDSRAGLGTLYATHSGQVGALEALVMLGALSSLVQKPEENIEVLPYFPHAMVPTTGGSRVVGTF
jgi:hypothetical protein